MWPIVGIQKRQKPPSSVSNRFNVRRNTDAGGRKVQAWTAQHRTVRVPFNLPGDAPDAFFNANTLAELHALENR